VSSTRRRMPSKPLRRAARAQKRVARRRGAVRGAAQTAWSAHRTARDDDKASICGTGARTAGARLGWGRPHWWPTEVEDGHNA
jgi:hypothetical protein